MPITRYHTFWRRIGALTIDSLLSSLFVSGLLCIFYLFTSRSWTWFVMLNVATNLATAAYFILMPARSGQTLGKMAAGVVIENIDGSPITYEQAFLRHLPRLALGICGSILALYWLWGIPRIELHSFRTMPHFMRLISVLWLVAEALTVVSNDRLRAIHDFIANTVVVLIPPNHSPDPTLASGTSSAGQEPRYR
jgi:uncharacterized RDD family membrane protein YckC